MQLESGIGDEVKIGWSRIELNQCNSIVDLLFAQPFSFENFRSQFLKDRKPISSQSKPRKEKKMVFGETLS